MSVTLPLSMFYLSLLSCLAIYCTVAVVKMRLKTSIGLSHGDDEGLTRQIRVQANFLENLLPFSMLFILTELSGFSTIFLHVVGTVFLLARMAHAYGFSKRSGKSLGRYYGTIATWLIVISLIIVNLYLAIMTMIG